MKPQIFTEIVGRIMDIYNGKHKGVLPILTVYITLEDASGNEGK